MDEVVIVVESDKGEAPVRSTHKGVITGFLFKEGDDVKIGSPMFEIDTEASNASGQAQTQAAPQQAVKPEPKKEEPKVQAAQEPKRTEEPKAAPKPEAKPQATPASGAAAQGDTIRFGSSTLTERSQSTSDKRRERR